MSTSTPSGRIRETSFSLRSTARAENLSTKAQTCKQVQRPKAHRFPTKAHTLLSLSPSLTMQFKLREIVAVAHSQMDSVRFASACPHSDCSSKPAARRRATKRTTAAFPLSLPVGRAERTSSSRRPRQATSICEQLLLLLLLLKLLLLLQRIRAKGCPSPQCGMQIAITQSRPSYPASLSAEWTAELAKCRLGECERQCSRQDLRSAEAATAESSAEPSLRPAG